MNPNPKLNIEKYEVDLKRNVITFQLLEHEGTQLGEAVFTRVWGHQFSNVLSGNYVVSIKECSPEDFHKKYTPELEEYQQCGFPFNAYKPAEFCADIERRSLKPIIITDQYGFSGWVLCEDIRITLGGSKVAYQ